MATSKDILKVVATKLFYYDFFALTHGKHVVGTTFYLNDSVNFLVLFMHITEIIKMNIAQSFIVLSPWQSALLMILNRNRERIVKLAAN